MISNAASAGKFAEGEMLRTEGWGNLEVASRLAVLRRICDCINERRRDLAALEASESGKFFRDALGEIDSCVQLWNYAVKLLNLELRTTEEFRILGGNLIGKITYRPLGPVLMITPFNYPLVVLSERLPFALAAGASVVVKPSEITPSSTVELCRLARECGLPEHAFQVVLGDGKVGTQLVSDSAFKLVSFTGSSRTAQAVSALIDHRSVRTSFELGGKNSFIVLKDADLVGAAESAVYAATINGGQACIAPSRLVVEDSIFEEFSERLNVHLSEIVLRNLREFGVPIQQPPTESHIARAKLHLRNIHESNWEPADYWINDIPSNALGDFVRPHIFKVPRPNGDLFNEEFFVPFLTLSSFVGLDEAVDLANSGDMGLAAYFWTNSRDSMLQLHRRVRAGRQWWNCDMRSFSPELPIGGFGLSGIGRELGVDALNHYRLSSAATMVLTDRVHSDFE